MTCDAIVVGAGLSGLALALHLRSNGRTPLVLDRARGVGGRCATRRVDGQPVDHGLTFFHGSGDALREALAGLASGSGIPDWPRTREGQGAPCRPEAFDGSGWRMAVVEGVSRLPKLLAAGLEVRLHSVVTGLSAVADRETPSGRAWQLALGSGETFRTETLALTMPAPSTLRLLEGMTPRPGRVDELRPLLAQVRMLPCLTVIARYPVGTSWPEWEVSLPRSSSAIQSVFHDSSKRGPSAKLMLVIQGRARFSRDRAHEAEERWSRELLREAAAIHGDWVATPELVQAHRWRYARVAPGTELAGPLHLEVEEAGVLGIAGDGFHSAGGAEGAYRSGLELATRWSDRATIPLSSQRREPCH